MKKYISALCMMLTGALFITSCLSDEKEDTTEYYKNTAITAFSISCINRYIHTTSSTGADSVYKTSLSNPVVFTIDQIQHKIYNTDSLPSDCDVKHVLASISSLNSGMLIVNYTDKSGNDSLIYYSSTDSINFAQVKNLRVYSQQGDNYRDYNISINIHKATNDKIIWEKKTTDDLPADSKSVLWKQKATAAGMKTLIGYGIAEGYAFDNNGMLMVSKDNGDTWSVDELDEDTALLPTDNFAFASWPFSANDSTDYQMLVGTNDKIDKACVVWRKIAEYAKNSLPSKWVMIPTEDHYQSYLPKMENLNLVRFNNQVMAIGNDSKIYLSRDQGITWKTTSKYTLPETLGTNNLSATTDDNGYLWLVGIDTGEVWRGLIIE